MRVLVATDVIGALSSAAAGRIIAGGWRGAETLVLPVGEAGAGFIAATADRWDLAIGPEFVGDVVVTSATGRGIGLLRVEDVTPAPAPIPYDASSRPIGVALGRLLDGRRIERVYLDLAGLTVHDGGAGLLAGLGATAGGVLDRGVTGLLPGLGSVDLAPVRMALGGTELIGVVPADQAGQALLGLRGITSLARGAEPDPARLLAVDAALEDLARLVAPEHASTPGAGACGGLGLAVLALGGRLTTGPAAALADVAVTGVDLVVTGTSVFDFASRGGGVVAALAQTAGAHLSPCLVLAGEVMIGGREMRTMGVDAAYPVWSAPGPAGRPKGSAGGTPKGSAAGTAPQLEATASEATALEATARRVARSWTW